MAQQPSPAPRRSSTAGHVAAAATAAAAAVLMTWPLAREASDHLLGAIYYWDAYTNAMIMGGHVDAVLGRGPLSLYDDYFFAPLPNSIVFNENLFGLSLLFAPFYLASHNPLWAYNLTLLSSLSLSVFFTYLLVRRLTHNGYAGVLAGVAFAFSPYIMFEIGRLQLVATQWIPACFLMLHRTIEGRRLRDVVGFWLCYLLQVGTCLYYAMFLIPLLALTATILLVRRRPARKLYAELAAVGAAAAVVALAMVYPYFTARDAFSLERSLSFASSYDGKLGFFLNVPETNLTLTALHHRGAFRGAHEEIAFPGFTPLALALLSLGVPLWRAVRGWGPWRVGTLAGTWLAVAVVTLAATLLAHSMLAGAVVLGFGIWRQARVGGPFLFSGRRGLYFGLLLLSIVMFLGLWPLQWHQAPVRGLYYYFHSYFPGFNGIRKVSRQAVMTTFVFIVLSSFGSAWLLSRFARPWLRAAVLCALLGATCYELRSFPHPLQSVWAGASVPGAYRFLASRPSRDRVAAIPQDDGIRRFSGDAGMAYHNYLALYHKHRFLSGQSSWLPPVTDLVLGALRHLPDDGARRILQAVGARYILVHAEDLRPPRRDLPRQLGAQPEHYREVFRQDMQSVFSLSAASDATLALAETPALPASARPIASSELRANASTRPVLARQGIDRNPRTFWSAWRSQRRGQYFELELARPRRLIAFEIHNPGHPSEVPLSFQLAAAHGGSDWQVVADQPLLRVYRDQVYSPRTFVFRIVLPKPTLADRIRLTIGQPVPGHRFVIEEARIYAQGE